MTRHPRSSSSSSSNKKFDVFEFNEQEEQIEKTSQRLLGKFKNPSNSPISKYQFLEVFARGSATVSNHVTSDPIDLDDEVSCESDVEAKCSTEKVTNKPLEVDDDGGGNGTGTCINNEVMHTNSCPIDMSLRDCADREIDGFADFVESDFASKNQSLDMVSDDDDDSQIISSTSKLSRSEVEVSLEDHLVELGPIAFEINDIKKVVCVFPDFIRYEDLYATRSRLIFSCSSLKLEGSTINGIGGTFIIEWPCEDIIKIESYWFGKVETAMINLLLKPKDSSKAGNNNQNPGFKRLRFAVYDPTWSKAEEAIKLLDTRYIDIWSTVFDIDTDNNENVSPLGEYSLFSQKHYFPIYKRGSSGELGSVMSVLKMKRLGVGNFASKNSALAASFDEAFDEVIYPKGEPDAVSISKRDLQLLQPETFINDTIIDFYIKYLKNKIPPDEQNRFHFFNSFFFRKLADLDKDPSSACDGRAAFQRVRKWTRKVNLFEKDYILIPINYSLHWSLIVICHPGEVVCFKDEEIKESSKVPCILHMDSLKGSHKGLKNVFQSYLCEEWKERHSNPVDGVSNFLRLRFISLELPQQENFYDCGIFLLHYVERFLKEAPVNFNPFKITKFSNFLNRNWFPPPEASLKRSHIQNLIYNIFNDNSLKAPPADCLDQGLSSEGLGILKHKVEADSLAGSNYPAIWHGDNPSSSTPEQEADIQFQATSPLRVASCLREPGLVFSGLQGAPVNSHSSNCLQVSACYQRGLLSPIEETEESCEEAALSLEIENSQVAILTSDLPSTSYISKDHRASETSLQGIPVNSVGAVDSDSSWNTLETGVHGDQLLKRSEGSNIPDKTDALEYLSTSDEEVVQDSQEANDDPDVDVSVKCRSSFQGNLNSVTHKYFDSARNMSLGDDTLICKKEPLTSESDKRDAKRPKLTNAGSQRRRFTRRMSKEACLMSCE